MTDPVPTGPLAKAKAEDLTILEEDARRFLTRERPGTDAVVLALLKPRDTILRKYRESLDAMTRASVGADMAFLSPTGRLIEGDGTSAWMAIGETVVAKAILGDPACIGQVLDRVEGKAGQRRGEDDGAYEKRAEIMQSLEGMVRMMNATPVEATVVTPPANGHDKPNGSDS